jgi:hypothetical protein
MERHRITQHNHLVNSDSRDRVTRAGSDIRASSTQLDGALTAAELSDRMPSENQGLLTPAATPAVGWVLLFD